MLCQPQDETLTWDLGLSPSSAVVPTAHEVFGTLNRSQPGLLGSKKTCSSAKNLRLPGGESSRGSARRPPSKSARESVRSISAVLQLFGRRVRSCRSLTCRFHHPAPMGLWGWLGNGFESFDGLAPRTESGLEGLHLSSQIKLDLGQRSDEDKTNRLIARHVLPGP